MSPDRAADVASRASPRSCQRPRSYPAQVREERGDLVVEERAILPRGQLDDPKRDEAIRTIERNAMMQAKLLDELLDLTRIVTGTVTLDVRPIDIGEIRRGRRLAASAG